MRSFLEARNSLAHAYLHTRATRLVEIAWWMLKRQEHFYIDKGREKTRDMIGLIVPCVLEGE